MIQPASTIETLDLARGSVVVCVPLLAADPPALTCLRSVLEHSDARIPIILAGSPTTLEGLAQALDVEIRDRTIVGLAPQRDTAVCALNATIAASFPSDVAFVRAGVQVSPGWLRGLQGAATSDSIVASATPLSLGAGAVMLAGADPSDAGEAAIAIRQSALDLHPRIATIGPGCAYIRRAALELAGPLDESKGLSEALADLAMRMTSLGMIHVVADDVLVGGSSEPQEPPRGSTAPSAPVENDVQAVIANDERGSCVE